MYAATRRVTVPRRVPVPRRVTVPRKGVSAEKVDSPEKGGVGKISSVAVRKRVVWCWQTLHTTSWLSATQIGQGVCDDCDGYGAYKQCRFRRAS